MFPRQPIDRPPAQTRQLVAPAVRKRRYTRYTRDNAHFMRVSCVVCAATARNIVRRSRDIGRFVSRLGVACRGFGTQGATPSALKRLVCCPCSPCSAFLGQGREVAPPGVMQISAAITLEDDVFDPNVLRLDVIVAQPPRQLVVAQRLAFEISPRRILEFVQLGQDGLGVERVVVPAENRPQVGQQPEIQAGLDLASNRHQCHRRPPGALCPLPAGNVGEREQRLPHIGSAVLDTGRHFRSRLCCLVDDAGGPSGQPLPQTFALRGVDAAAERFDFLAVCTGGASG